MFEEIWKILKSKAEFLSRILIFRWKYFYFGRKPFVSSSSIDSLVFQTQFIAFASLMKQIIDVKILQNVLLKFNNSQYIAYVLLSLYKSLLS